MLTRFLNLVSVLFIGIAFGAISGAAIAFVGYNADLEKAGYTWSIRKRTLEEKNED